MTVTRRWVAVDHPGWRQAHASSVVDAGGTLLAAWFAGTAEGTADNRIWLARRPVGSPTWGEPEVLAAGTEAHWNPVLTLGPDGAVWLFYKRGPRISTWATWYRRSTDAGRTWTAPAELVPGDTGGRGPVKNPPLLLPDGTWLAPASTESGDAAPRWEAFVDRSTDGGRTWTAVPIPVDRARTRGAGVIQPALWRRGPSVLALLRSTEGTAFRARSEDGGSTWSTAEPTTLPNNNAGLTAVAVDDAVVCVHNPVAESWGPRCPLVVSVSHDDGATWRQACVIDDGRTPLDDHPDRRPSRPGPHAFAAADTGVVTTGVGEYSYPSAVVHDGVLTVTYSWQRRGIVEATVPLGVVRS